MKKTIIIADDFENTRFVTRFMLEKAGYNILEAKDGKEALGYFDGRQIDLLVADYYMPEMDGITLTKEIKKIKQYNNLPILIMSLEKSEEKMQEGYLAGALGWISKPFSLDRFIILINKALTN